MEFDKTGIQVQVISSSFEQLPTKSTKRSQSLNNSTSGTYQKGKQVMQSESSTRKLQALKERNPSVIEASSIEALTTSYATKPSRSMATSYGTRHEDRLRDGPVIPDENIYVAGQAKGYPSKSPELPAHIPATTILAPKPTLRTL